MAEKSLDEMSLDELDAVLDGRAPVVDEVSEGEETTEESVAEEVVEEPTAEVEEVEATTEEATEEPEQPAEPEPEQQQIDESAELRALAKKWEAVAGRHGGEIGYLKKANQTLKEQLEQAIAGRPQENEEDQEYAQPRRDPAPLPRAREDKIAQWATKQAISTTAAQFVADHPEYKDHINDLQQYMADSGIDLSLAGDLDPETIQRDTNRILTEHYWHVRAKLDAAIVAERKAKRAEQTEKLPEAKRRAATTGSGARAAPKPREKTLDEMTLDELDKMLQTGTGGQW